MPTCEVIEGSLVITQCNPSEQAIARNIACRVWDRRRQGWRYPIRPEIIEELSLALKVPIPQEARELCAEIREREEKVKEAKLQGWARAEPVAPMPLKCVPFNHQVMGFNLGMTLPNIALLAEMGTGKTVMSLAIAARRYQRKEVNRVLVVCPSSVVPVWPKEIFNYLDVPCEVQRLDKTSEKAKNLLADWDRDPKYLQFLILNYEKTWRLEKELLAWGADLIICDESQRIKNPGAKQSKTMHKLGKQAKYRMILTGTPVNNHPLDFHSQYKFLDPSIFGEAFTPFKARYATVKQLPNGGEIILAYKNMDELVQKAHSIAFRVTKAEALDLPETINQTLYCDLEDKAKAQYRMMAKESVIELSKGTLAAPEVITRLLRLSQITGGFIDGEEVSRVKLNLLKDTLSDLLDAGEKVVCFYRFLAEGEAIRKELEKLKVQHSFIRGDVPMAQRGEEVERFQTDPECRVFLAQIATAGLGITLHAADTEIFYSYDYSYAVHEQAMARIHRLGQENKCTFIHLVARGTIDEKILQVLQEKGDIAKLVVDDWREWLG